MWVLDMLDEVISDFSVFHRIEHPLELDSPRFFRLANQLVHYSGAVRGAMRMQHEKSKAAPVTFDDVETLVAMSEDSTGQFPTIGHAGG